MKRHSIVFCGTPDFATTCLKALASDERFDVQLVITQPDRPVGRGKEMTPPDVKVTAQELGISVLQPEDINADFNAVSSTLSTRPDFLVVVAYGQILTQQVLDWPTIAPVNVHASILPRWRGASPIEHAVLHGDKETGVALQRMVLELDAGTILAIAKTPIGERENSLQLRERLAPLGASLLTDTLSKPLHETPQSTEGVTFCPRLSRDDGKADSATEAAEEIDRKVRAFTPWPSVRMTVNGRELKVLETDLSLTATSTPVVCAKNTTLHLVRVQEAGGKPMTGIEWERGLKR